MHNIWCNVDKIEDWVSGTSYLLKDLVIYSDSIWQCTTANTDVVWTPANWNCVSTGADGADGINAYVYIKYATIQPIQDSDMIDTPNEWIGIYSGISSTAPTTYTSYTWYKIKGDTGIKGNTGDSGTDGSHIYYGTACTGTSETGVVFTTGITNANIDDTYINTSTSNLYRCNLGGDDTTATWIYVNSLKGADGSGVQINDSSTTSTTETWSVNKINTTKQDKITISSTLTLTVADWDSETKTQKVLTTLNTSYVNSIIYDLPWDMVISSAVTPSLEETTGITFKCTTIPTSDITFKIETVVV